ncbi:hypothetical protein [Methylococcus sp. EFPC2]|uniref:hypothetical protein n=1 Tax=Methylococcus sp. EFPC2 TaxID=2812648 RepID=UPI0019678DA9|nr:hypothetical protein [Methylococcus sp. EFPC2]QSA97509.1 hypothetical protein JWZ97_01275 [Methylococcus sp. EFPC2]
MAEEDNLIEPMGKPLDAARQILETLSALHYAWFPGNNGQKFMSELPEVTVSGEATSVYASPEALFESLSAKGSVGVRAESFMMASIARLYCKSAVFADLQGDSNKAWAHVGVAYYWLGMATGSSYPEDTIIQDAMSRLAKKAATVRHAENRFIKEQALAHYEKNMGMYKSLDAAAEDIAGKVVPAKFRTVRKWLTQFNKLQSARRG